MKVFYACVGAAIYVILVIMLIWFLKRYNAIKKLRQGKCVFEGIPLSNKLIKDESYREKDKEVFKSGMNGGNVYVEKNPTIIKGKYVKGARVYSLKSENLGYEIERIEEPLVKSVTPKWTMDSTDTPTFKDVDHISFRLIDEGKLTQKQTEKLKKIIENAAYEI